MLAAIGSWYGFIAIGAAILFMVVLGFVSIEDGWKHRRRRD